MRLHLLVSIVLAVCASGLAVPPQDADGLPDTTPKPRFLVPRDFDFLRELLFCRSQTCGPDGADPLDMITADKADPGSLDRECTAKCREGRTWISQTKYTWKCNLNTRRCEMYRLHGE